MANKSIFALRPPASCSRMRMPSTMRARRPTRMTPEHSLAQFAVTGTLNATFYAERAASSSPTCWHCARKGRARVHRQDGGLCPPARPHEGHACAAVRGAVDAARRRHFDAGVRRVIDNGKMLRNFVQIMRSGRRGGSRSARGRSAGRSGGWSRRPTSRSCARRSARTRRWRM